MRFGNRLIGWKSWTGKGFPGHRGMLLAKYQYEDQFKLKIAHRLDKISEALNEQGKKIAEDPDLQLMVKQNRNQTREIILQLDPISSKKADFASPKLSWNPKEARLAEALSSFFDTNDENFRIDIDISMPNLLR